MALFEKRAGAPAGSITITTDENVYTISDGGTITVTDTDDIQALRAHPFVQLQGGTGGPFVPQPVIEQVFLKDGVLSRTRDGSPIPVTGSFLHNGSPFVGVPDFQDADKAYLVGLGLDYGLRPTADKTAAFTAGLGDFVVCDSTTAGFAVTAPGPSQEAFAKCGVYNRIGGNNITFQLPGGTGDTFADGTTSKTVVPGEYVVAEYTPTRNMWTPVSQGLARAAADARYALAGSGGGGSGWSQVPDGLMGIAHPGIPDNVGMAWTVALEPKGIRVKCNKTGTLSSLYINVGASNGNWIGAVYDTGQATSGSRTQLWKGISVASVAGWLKLGTPGIAVTAGQWYDFVVNNDGTTATLKQFANSGLSAKLPNDLWPDTPGAATAKLAFKLAVQGTLDVPTGPIVDGSVTVNGKVPGIFGLVT